MTDKNPDVVALREAIASGNAMRVALAAAAIPAARASANPLVSVLDAAVTNGGPEIVGAIVGAHPQVSGWLAGKALMAALKAGALDAALDLVLHHRPTVLPIASLLLRAVEHRRADVVRQLGAARPDLFAGFAADRFITQAAAAHDVSMVLALVDLEGVQARARRARDALLLCLAAHDDVLSALVGLDAGDGNVVMQALAADQIVGTLRTSQYERVLNLWRPARALLETTAEHGWRGVILSPGLLTAVREYLLRLQRLTLLQSIGNDGAALP